MAKIAKIRSFRKIDKHAIISETIGAGRAMNEMKINPMILDGQQSADLSVFEMAKRKAIGSSSDEIWRMYAPPRTLGATEEHQLAMDEALQACGYHSLLAHAVGLGMNSFEIAPQFLGYPYLSGLSQNAIIRAGVTTTADEMTKKWLEVHHGGKRSEKAKAIASSMDDFNLKEIFNEAAQHCDFSGGCLVYIDTGETDSEKLQYPLYTDPKMFGDRRIERFTIVEPINLYPGLYNAVDPLRKDYFKPTHWMVLGRKVHASRFLYFAPNKLPLLLKPSYNFFGIPAAQTALDYVAHFTKTREAAQRLLTKFSLTVFKSNMSTIFQGGSAANFDMRMQYLTQWRDNDMILAIDKETEDVVKVDSSIAGTTDVVRQALEFVAAVFRIPFVKFLGISPGGLNATGESDLRNFYDHIASKQEKIFKPQVNRVIDLLQLHLFREIDPSMKATFCPLNDEDDSQREATQKTKADRLVVLAGAGIIDEVEARRALAEDQEGDLSFINPEEVPEPAQSGEEDMEGAMMREEGAMAAMDAALEEDTKWITANGTHIPIKDGELQGVVGSKISGSESTGEANSSKKNTRVKEFNRENATNSEIAKKMASGGKVSLNGDSPADNLINSFASESGLKGADGVEFFENSNDAFWKSADGLYNSGKSKILISEKTRNKANEQVKLIRQKIEDGSDSEEIDLNGGLQVAVHESIHARAAYARKARDSSDKYGDTEDTKDEDSTYGIDEGMTEFIARKITGDYVKEKTGYRGNITVSGGPYEKQIKALDSFFKASCNKSVDDFLPNMTKILFSGVKGEGLKSAFKRLVLKNGAKKDDFKYIWNDLVRQSLF